MNQAQRVMTDLMTEETMGPSMKKYLGLVLKHATGAEVNVDVGDHIIVISGPKEAVRQARVLMDKVVGLRLDQIEPDEKGNVRATFVEIGVLQTAPGVSPKVEPTNK